ncbi:hypothetical protein JCM5353_000705 [Sporobolomyces roseus]
MMDLPSVWSTNQARHRVLILRHESQRIATTVPDSLEATLPFALARFPSLRPPLRITRDIPEAGGAVEISEEVWKTELIDIDGILILDVHETGVREMSAEKDDSNASGPLTAVPEAVVEMTEAHTNEEDPSTSSGTLEAALAQAEPIPKARPAEPISRSPPPSPPQPLPEPVKTAHEWIEVRVDVYINQTCVNSHFRARPQVKISNITKVIAKIYEVSLQDVEAASTITHYGERIRRGATISDLLEDDDDELELELFSTVVGGIPEEDWKYSVATGNPIPLRRDVLSLLLNPLPATDPYVP